MKQISSILIAAAMLPSFVTMNTSCTSRVSHDDHEMHDHQSEKGHDHESEEDHDHEHGGEESSLLTVHIEDADADLLGISVDTIGLSQFAPALTVAGELGSSSSRSAMAVAPTSGVVKIGDAITVGARVAPGQTIATIDASRVGGSDIQADAEAALRAAKEEYERLRPLRERGLVTATQLNQAREAYERAKAAISPAAGARRATAPVEGVITDILAPNGSYVEAGQPIAVISGGGALTLRANVPDRHSSFIAGLSGAVIRPAGSERTIDIADYNGRLLTSGAGTSVNGYIPVSFTLDNPGLPGGNTVVSVDLLGAPVNGVIAVPREAVINDQGYTFVYVVTEPEHYLKTPVTTGRSDGRRLEITSGLHAGDRIVSAGAPMVRMAQNQAIPVEGHNHNH